MPSSSGQRLLRILVSLCLLIQSAGCQVDHSHGGGLSTHSHGFSVLSVSSAPAQSSTPSRTGLSIRHRHLVLFGIEVHSTSDASIPVAPDSSRVHLGLAVDSLNESASPSAGLASEAGFLPVLLESPTLVGFPLAFRLPTASPAVSRCTLCDQARGERSGVRLT